MTVSVPMGTGQIYWDDAGIKATAIPIDLSSGTQVKIRVITVPVLPGDLLKVTGEVNVTNDANRPDAPYPVGIATQLWLYDASTPPTEDRLATWRLLGQNGENVTVDGHHLQQGLTRAYVIPASWVPGRYAGISLSVDAHSTGEKAGRDDTIKVENHGCLIVERWRQGAAA